MPPPPSEWMWRCFVCSGEASNAPNPSTLANIRDAQERRGIESTNGDYPGVGLHPDSRII